jgi:hypothetical protein
VLIKWFFKFCGHSSIGRVVAFQATGYGFDARCPLQLFFQWSSVMKKAAVVGVVPKPRKDVSVRFRAGAGSHTKREKVLRREVRIALKRGQEVFQSVPV